MICRFARRTAQKYTDGCDENELVSSLCPKKQMITFRRRAESANESLVKLMNPPPARSFMYLGRQWAMSAFQMIAIFFSRTPFNYITEFVININV